MRQFVPVSKNTALLGSRRWLAAKRPIQRTISRYASSYSTQAAPELKADDVEDAIEKHDDGLESVIDILGSKSLAWSSPGPAQFDFRSKSNPISSSV